MADRSATARQLVRRMPPFPPIRLQLMRVRGFDLQEISRAANGRAAIVCRRPAKWGNRWKVFHDGANWCVTYYTQSIIIVSFETEEQARRIAIDRFRRDAEPRIAEIRADLAGYNLACTCALDQPCHVDVVLEIANP